MIWLDCGDDSSALFDVNSFVSFFSVSSVLRLPVKNWFVVCSFVIVDSDEIVWLLICSFGICWDDVDGGGSGAFAFRRVPGDLNYCLFI